MSTADGAILALGTVMSNNLFRQLDYFRPGLVNPENLLLVARISTLPLTLASTCIAAYFRSLDDAKAAGSTGYLLIVAFDIVFATVVVPLFGAFYAKNPSPRAALLSILGGGFTRIILEFVLQKDGSLLLPFDGVEYLNYGEAASSLPPPFVNATEVWDPSEEQCDQEPFSDFTGVDSLAAPFVSLILFVSVQWWEHVKERPLFEFPGSQGYEKSHKKEKDTVQHWTSAFEVIFSVIVSSANCCTMNME
jgi:Na+/proline symporter